MNNCNHPHVIASSVPNVYECIDCNFLSAGLPLGSGVIAVAASQTKNPVKQFIYNPSCFNSQGHTFNFNSNASTYTCIYCPYIIAGSEATRMGVSDSKDLRRRAKYRDGGLLPGMGVLPLSLQPVQQGVNPTHMPLTIADLQEVVDKYRIQYGREPNDILVSDLLRHYIPSNAYGGYINNVPVHFGDTSPDVYSIFALGPNATYMEKNLSIPVSSHTTSIISSGLWSGALTQGPGTQAAPITLPLPYGLIQGLGPKQEELNRVHRAVCAHTWQHYAGLTEVYDFCTKCDEKKR